MHVQNKRWLNRSAIKEHGPYKLEQPEPLLHDAPRHRAVRAVVGEGCPILQVEMLPVVDDV